MAGINTTAKITSVFLLLLFAVGVWGTKAVYAAAPRLELDGVGTTPISCTSFACFYVTGTQLITTTRGHDVIILIVGCAFACGNISSITDSSGLKFAQRVSYAARGELWEYYAVATSPLKSDNVTVEIQNTNLCIEWCGMQVLAIHGANTRAIFDPNPSIPATVSCPGPNGCLLASIQTSTFDFVIASTAIDDAGPCVSGPDSEAPPGFTNLAFNDKFEVDYSITTTPQSSVVFNCNGIDTDPMEIVLDAISFYGAFGI